MNDARNIEWQVLCLYQSISDTQARDQAILRLLNKSSKGDTYIIKRIIADMQQKDDGTYFLTYDPLRSLVL